MSYLLDTNVVSEWTNPAPDPAVVRWLDDVDEDRAYLSVITFGELRDGVDRLDPGRKRDRLDSWLRTELIDRFERRLLGVDVAVAHEWGAVRAVAGRSGRTLPVADALIAATAVVYSLAIVTRNVKDFAGLGPEVIDPANAR